MSAAAVARAAPALPLLRALAGCARPAAAGATAHRPAALRPRQAVRRCGSPAGDPQGTLLCGGRRRRAAARGRGSLDPGAGAADAPPLAALSAWPARQRSPCRTPHPGVHAGPGCGPGCAAAGTRARAATPARQRRPRGSGCLRSPAPGVCCAPARARAAAAVLLSRGRLRQ